MINITDEINAVLTPSYKYVKKFGVTYHKYTKILTGHKLSGEEKAVRFEIIKAALNKLSKATNVLDRAKREAVK